MDYLNQAALEQMPHETLEAYTVSLEQEIAKRIIYLAQVRSEWDRRSPEQ